MFKKCYSLFLLSGRLNFEITCNICYVSETYANSVSASDLKDYSINLAFILFMLSVVLHISAVYLTYAHVAFFLEGERGRTYLWPAGPLVDAYGQC